MPTQSSPMWGEAERRRLRAARKAVGHSQELCAEVLRTQYGVEDASQPNVARWESGATKRPSKVAGVLEYVGTYLPPSPSPAAEPSSTNQADDRFTDITRQVSGGPLLGPMQVEFIRAVNARLSNGPPLSPEDRQKYLDQAELLGLASHSSVGH